MTGPSPHDMTGPDVQPRDGGSPELERLGQYLLLGKLGQGGMGTVYKALHTRLKRVVALKVLPADRAHDSQMVARFHREMEAIGRLDQPHIVRATDAGEIDGRHFLVMEYVDGLDLAAVSRLCGPLLVADACELVRQAAVGLQSAHEAGLVHRDVKPSNLMLAVDGRVKVLDLGLARLQGGRPAAEELTGSGQVVGTADYMAPEQGSGRGPVDIRADIYSLGCTLYKLLAGQPPFASPRYDSALRKLWAHAHAAVPPVQEQRSDVPGVLAAVLDRLLAKSPDDRPVTPADVAAALRPFAAGCDLTALLAAARARQMTPGHGPVPAAPPSAETRVPAAQAAPPTEPAPGRAAPLAARRRRKVAAAGLSAAILLAGLVAAWLVLSHRGPPETAPQPPRPGLGVWRDLLEHSPVPLQWPRASVTSRWDLKKQQQELWVNADDEGLLRLGDAAAPPYEMEVFIQQIQWGNAGLFFGHHDGQVQGRPCKRFQLVQLVSRLDNTPAQGFALERLLVHRLTETAAIHQVVASASVPRPASDEHRLGIVIGKGGLESVRWDGAELPGLATPAVNARLEGADYRGFFGVYNMRSTSVFRKPRFRFLPEGQ